jgi:antitoxin CptB
MALDYDINRLYWHSRRGMLELDLVLMPFVTEDFESLDEADKERYIRLLECEDQDLFGWFLQHKQVDDPELARIVEIILTTHKSRGAAS